MRCWLIALWLAVALVAPGQEGASRGQGIVAAPDGKTPVGEQHLFIISINRYQHWNPLTGAVAEAAKLREVLLQRYAFSPEKTVTLEDAAATREAIVKQLRVYAAALAPHDSLLILYCGHGYLDTYSDRGFWIPTDGGLDDVKQENWLSNAELRGYLKRIPARHILVISDACFSGQLLTVSRAKPEEITDEYYRRAYQLVARQVMTSGGLEVVNDASAFGDALHRELVANREPYIDPAKLFINVRAAVKGQQPLLGSVDDSGHQEGGSYLFFLRPDAPREKVPPPRLEETGEIVETGSIELQCRLTGKLRLDEQVIGTVFAGKVYTLRDIVVGEHRLTIVGEDGQWSEAVQVRPRATSRVTMAAPAGADLPVADGPVAGKLYAVAGLQLPLVWVAPGAFRMGSAANSPDHFEDETAHDVELTRGYWMGAVEVRVKDFEAFVLASRYRTQAEQDGWAHAWVGEAWGKVRDASWRQPGFTQTAEHPVVCVSWNDAGRFCEWLTERERAAGRLPAGHVYRLPTEAEWEFACRAGGRTAFAWGDEAAGGKGWCNAAYQAEKDTFRGWEVFAEVDGHIYTAPTGTFKANGWGLQDMHGNVGEWCADWYGDYPAVRVADPRGAEDGDGRVFRGGSWYTEPARCRSAFRMGAVPEFRDSDLGFRIVLAPPIGGR